MYFSKTKKKSLTNQNHRKITNQFYYQICLGNDNGEKYISHVFNHFCETHGILWKFMTPCTFWNKMVVKHKNCTLVESARNMFKQAKNYFIICWLKLLTQCATFHNKSLTTTISNKRPFETWCGKKPNVSNLHIFGCIADVQIPKNVQLLFQINFDSISFTFDWNFHVIYLICLGHPTKTSNPIGFWFLYRIHHVFHEDFKS